MTKLLCAIGLASLLPVSPVLADGACCLPDATCEAAVDTAACSAAGGVFLPDLDCGNEPCADGACCVEMDCSVADAFSCISAGREFAGAGVSCLDDPCDAGIGACCFGEDCTDLAPDSCNTQGGQWLGPGTTCGSVPCVLGGCCLPDGACEDLAAHACDDVGGLHAPRLPCGKGPCDEDDACPDGTLFGQGPDGPDDFLAGTSELNAGFARFEDFGPLPGAVSALTWWGVDLDFVGGGFVECDEPDPTFRISFHLDAAGEPGAEVCGYEVTATRTPLGIFYLGAELNEYRVDLPEPCVLVRGWVSIVGMGDPECWFLWMSAGLVGGGSYCEGCLPGAQDIDLAVCLEGDVGGVFGACCNESAATCLDDVEIVNCLAPNDRFLPNATCADVDPPCGTVIGACCFPDTCTIEEVEACSSVGGNWLGANTLCSQCPCLNVCPPEALAEGEQDCEDEYVDDFNGGCNALVPAFVTIDLDTTVCGTSGIYAAGGDLVPDLDWYAFDVATQSTLRIFVDAEFPPRVVLLDGTNGCPGLERADVQATECEPVDLALPVNPATYWVVILPAAFTDSSACGNAYTLRITTTACLADVDGSGTVSFGDLLQVLSAWGACPAGAACPADVDQDGVVSFSDLLLVLSEWGSACASD